MDSTWPKKTADSFWFAAARNLEQRKLSPTQFQMLLSPGVVCLAFAIELGMKSIILRSTTPPRTHNLKKLFQHLPQPSQDRLVLACRMPVASFENKLGTIANLFEEWRYVYELQNPQVDLEFLSLLSDAVKLATDEQ